MFRVKQSGSFKNFERFARLTKAERMYQAVDALAQQGSMALAANTPKDTGLTAASWTYEVDISRGSCTITWSNSNVVNGFPIALGLQYGHGTGSGGYISGIDYINPAMRPILEQILNDVWKTVTET